MSATRGWLSLAALIVLVQALAAPLGLVELFAYGRAAIGSGEVWRLLTGQLTHAGWAHCVANAAGLAVAGALMHGCAGTAFWTTFLGGAVGVGAGLLTLSPDVSWYLGASGLTHAAILAGGILRLRDDSMIGTAVVALIILKVLAELVGWWPAIADTGFPVVHAAHVYGVAGAAMGIAVFGMRRSDALTGRGLQGSRLPSSSTSVERKRLRIAS